MRKGVQPLAVPPPRGTLAERSRKLKEERGDVELPPSEFWTMDIKGLKPPPEFRAVRPAQTYRGTARLGGPFTAPPPEFKIDYSGLSPPPGFRKPAFIKSLKEPVFITEPLIPTTPLKFPDKELTKDLIHHQLRNQRLMFPRQTGTVQDAPAPAPPTSDALFGAVVEEPEAESLEFQEYRRLRKQKKKEDKRKKKEAIRKMKTLQKTAPPKWSEEITLFDTRGAFPKTPTPSLVEKKYSTNPRLRTESEYFTEAIKKKAIKDVDELKEMKSAFQTRTGFPKKFLAHATTKKAHEQIRESYREWLRKRGELSETGIAEEVEEELEPILRKGADVQKSKQKTPKTERRRKKK